MKPVVYAIALAANLAFAGAAFAAGDSSSGSEEAPEPTQTTTACKKTEVYDEKLKKCVELKKSGMNDSFSDDELYDAARELAYFGRPDDAIVLLSQMSQQNQPRVQNYLGFAHRKAGRIDAAMMHYQAALQLDPDYVLARSYMGQGLLNSGNVGAARAQLAQINMRAGTDNYPYRMLSDALAGKPVGY